MKFYCPIASTRLLWIGFIGSLVGLAVATAIPTGHRVEFFSTGIVICFAAALPLVRKLRGH